MDDYLVLLAYLEDPSDWTEKSLQAAVVSVIDCVNAAGDITGILTAWLVTDLWGDDPLVSFFVQHDDRWDTPEEADEMIIQLFTKAIEICGYSDDLWILNGEEREYLDAGP